METMLVCLFVFELCEVYFTDVNSRGGGGLGRELEGDKM